jgi:hypothetical protein
MVKTDYDGINCCTDFKNKTTTQRTKKCLTAPSLARGGAGAHFMEKGCKQ